METLQLNKKLFKKKTVRQAVKAYNEFGAFGIEESGDYLMVRVEAEDTERERMLANEFGNYLLARVIEETTTL